MSVPRISGLHSIAPDYEVILCDVWGVLHNGKTHWPGAADALTRFRKSGGTVIMITNSPRPSSAVVEQFKTIGVPSADVYDAIVSSGDTTRSLISQVDGPAYFLGPERDQILLKGLDVRLSGLEDASAVVCTGLIDDEKETPEDYAELLADIKNRALPFICANPDIIVERGERMIWCAGALARDYECLGGEVRLAGKPHPPIYETAIELATELNGSRPTQEKILAIGDGMPTDVKGAQDFGLNLLYVSSGIHSNEYGSAENPDDSEVQSFLSNHGAIPVAYLPRLIW